MINPKKCPIIEFYFPNCLQLSGQVKSGPHRQNKDLSIRGSHVRGSRQGMYNGSFGVWAVDLALI